jgi:hypothetical protein
MTIPIIFEAYLKVDMLQVGSDKEKKELGFYRFLAGLIYNITYFNIL